MSAFEIVAMIGATAGLLMVVGGIGLFWKGVLTLQTTSGDAMTIEWKKQFRISTQAPGIAFFLVGLLFVTVSLIYLKPPPLVPIEFDGQITGVDEPVSIFVRPANWELPGDTSGKISGKVYPDLSVLLLVISAPGYEPFTTSISIKDEARRQARIGTLQLRRKVEETDLTKKVVDLPFKAPPVAAANPKAFGVSQ